ncbi:oligosaccharide biosynthesis protein Alg14 like-domain-containing protein [Rhodotorula diobovata]|uniref:UDP-N-acetylglucosamine transferase subunit ALG14 n=1 Tax=Rhodotorula diobovata TaxID=5288 RepID=A0A5C5FMI6_9BASI|nr:oligosaccharide biosynthesis protein Alg14 like-domain-containing protein [Rhodotorula diobovata]
MSVGHSLVLSAAALILLATLLTVRLIQVLVTTHHCPPPPRRPDEAHLAVFLGSGASPRARTPSTHTTADHPRPATGGHTAEMMRLVAHLDWTTRFTRRTWVISSGDSLSEAKALELERTISSGQFRILRIPRARRVHQSYLSSPFSTLYSLLSCLWHVTLAPLLSPAPAPKRRPRVFADVVLLNGPGSCVPLACAAFLPRLLSLPSPRLLYIESLARTRRLSLSARLVRPVVDRFFVQWDALRDELLRREGRGDARWGRLRARVECRGWLV